MIDVFSVGVRLSMTSSGMGALTVLIRDLSHAGHLSKELHGNLAKIGQVAVAAGAAFTGWAVVDGIWHAVESSRELNKELQKTKALGGEFASHIGDTRKRAAQTMQDVPTTSLSQNVRMERELGSSLGNPDAAGEILTQAAKVAAIVHSITGEDTEAIAKNLTRVADLRGQIYIMGADGKEHVDPVKLQAELEAGMRGLILGNGFIKSPDLVQEARQGGPAVKSQTPEAFYAAGVEAGIAMGPSKVGTAELSLLAQFVGGKMTKATAEHLQQAGLLHDGDWHSGRSGGVVVDPAASRRFEAIEKDPEAWLSSGAGAAAIRQYAEKNNISIIAAITQLLGRQTTQRFASDVLSNGPQFDRARQLYGIIPDVNTSFKEQMNNNLDMNITAVSAAWQSFTESFSEANTQPVILVLHGITSALHEATVLMEGHQAAVGYMTEFVAGFGGLLALGGSIRLASLALGPFTGAFRLLLGTMATGPITAAAAGATTLAAGLGTLTTVLTGGGAVAAIAALAKLGSDHEKEAQPFREQNRRDMGPTSPSNMAPQDGYDASGLPVHKSAYIPLGGSSRLPIQITVYSQLDGRIIAKAVSDHQADYASRPPSGSSAFDPRMSPFAPGQQIRT